jgi:arylsulfatase A-like enzyme
MRSAGNARGAASKTPIFSGVLVLALLGCKAGSPPPPRTPSIIVILIDTLRADYIGAYGFDGDVSPFLDRFAAESTLYEHCNSQSPSTLPSVASLFTSLHPSAHGVVKQSPSRIGRLLAAVKPSANAIPRDATTLAEALSTAGYSTAAFVANPWLDPQFRFDRGFHTFDMETAGLNTTADEIFASAWVWLDSAVTRSRPFFLYLHLMDVHGPYRAPSTDLSAVAASPSLGSDRELSAEELNRVPSYLRRPKWTKGTEGRSLRGWRARYAAGVHAVDRRIETFVEKLRLRGILEEAVVVVTSDHGEELCEHGGWNHGLKLYEHQLHVPLIIRYPSDELHGLRISEVVDLSDLTLTLLTVAETEIPKSIGGTDLSVAGGIRHRADADRISASAGIGTRPSLHSVRDTRHKLIVDLVTGETELYDLQDDPGEQLDLADQRPTTVARLMSQLRVELQRIEANAPDRGAVVEMNPVLVEQLRALGYLD